MTLPSSGALRSVCACAALLTLVLTSATAVVSQPPPGYYQSVDESTRAALRATLHAVIDDHQRFPYTSSATDTWDILELAQQDPSNSSNIVDINRNLSLVKQGGGNTFYNRDHIWPKSYGFPDDNSQNYPYTDCHQLHLSDDGYNSSRSNKPYRNCSASCSEQTTQATNGRGGGSGTYPGNSNWTSGQLTQGTWEQWRGTRGDIARALFYLDLRYEGGTHGITGAAEPDLILTDNESLIASSSTGNNEAVGYYGMLSVLLQWHHEDPVDAGELRRNDVVFSFQGNRNPFIDNPAWVDCLFAAPIAAQQIVRLGSPPNPQGLPPATIAPTIGAAWNPAFDHSSFMPDALVDVLILTAPGSEVNVPTVFGTMLCDLGTPAVTLVAPTPGAPIPIPLSSCVFAGLGVCVQGISANGSGLIRFTNALDVTIGS